MWPAVEAERVTAAVDGSDDRDAGVGSDRETDGRDRRADGAGHASRWPLVVAAGAASLYAGAGLAFVGLDLVPVALPALLVGAGAAGALTGLAGWFVEAFPSRPPAASDAADTAVGERAGGRAGERGDRHDGVYGAGMRLFLVSDVATFLAGFVYYAVVRAGAWPPADLPPLVGSLVVVNTVALLVSSLTLHLGHVGLADGDRRRFLAGLAATTLLGATFLVGQALEYREFVVEAGFTLAGGAFATAFYGLTGLHGLHVALGVVLLAITLGRASRGAFGPGRDTSVRTVSLYWHFVDAVWLLLVAVLYVGAVAG